MMQMQRLMGNHWFGGYGETLENSLYISLGEGIGCAQLLEGNIVRGRRFSAGEIGCLPSGNEKRPCSCGKMDCLQTYCGELGIIQSVKRKTRSLTLPLPTLSFSKKQLRNKTTTYPSLPATSSANIDNGCINRPRSNCSWMP